MSPKLEQSFGGLVTGVILSAILLGITTVQVFKYYVKFRQDRVSTKIVVGVLWVLSIFHIGFNTQTIYWNLITGFTIADHRHSGFWHMGVSEIAVVTTSAIVESFFVLRVYSMSSNIFLSVFVGSLVLVQFALGCVTAIRLCGTLTSVYPVERFIIPWLALQAAADIVIAGVMSYLLRRRRTGFKKTNSVLDKMALYAISTGVVTSLFGIAVLATSLGHVYWANVLATSLQNIYIVTMLASLHSRSGLRRELDSLETAGEINLSAAKPTLPTVPTTFGGESHPLQGSSRRITPSSGPIEVV